jgi:hypothetical protein
MHILLFIEAAGPSRCGGKQFNLQVNTMVREDFPRPVYLTLTYDGLKCPGDAARASSIGFINAIALLLTTSNRPPESSSCYRATAQKRNIAMIRTSERRSFSTTNARPILENSTRVEQLMLPQWSQNSVKSIETSA